MPGIQAPVAKTGHLIALKLLSYDRVKRPQDVIDLRSLTEHASSEDLSVAREAVQLITERGFHRDRDPSTALDTLLNTRTL